VCSNLNREYTMPTGILEMRLLEGRKLKDADLFTKSVRFF
jgi:hypothetical protein